MLTVPNWCENELTIRGKGADKVVEFLKGSQGALDFNKVVRQVKKWWPFKKPNYWFDRRVIHWGTKWNVGEEVRTVPMSRGAVKLCFDTAWAPPAPIVGRLSDLFQNNTFTLKYWEGGMGFRGKLVVKDGEVLENSSSDSYKGHRGG
jgi:hypothetical protein